jgi:N-acetylneuraminic acid mutarotase
MLYKNLNHYLIFIILYQLFSIMVYGQKFIPEPRIGTPAVLIENKIYYIGGDNPSKSKSEEDPESVIFYHDVNPDDKVNFLTWVDLKVKLPYTNGHAADVGGINQDSIFIIGGTHLDETNPNYLYKFDTKTLELSVPLIQGKAPPTFLARRSVSYKGKIYLFGGRTYTPVGNSLIYANQFDILDTINLNWQLGSMVNSPGALSGYSATLVNEIIYYIGGRSQQYVFSQMTDVCKAKLIKS